MDFLQLNGKRFLIFGVANKKSVAYAVSKALLEEGAECVFVVQNETILERASKLFPDSAFFTCNVENEDEIKALRERSAHGSTPSTGCSIRSRLPTIPKE